MGKIPYMLVIGDREQEEGTVTVRYRDSGENKTMSKEDFLQMVLEEIRTRSGSGQEQPEADRT